MSHRLVCTLAALTLVMLLSSCGSIRWMNRASTAALSAPPAGQVLVNIIRPSGFAGNQDMPIFDGTAATLIGNLEGHSRMQYVCPPGDRLFIGWGEHKSGVRSNLLADQVYDLICDVGMGVWRASVSLRPIHKVDERREKLPSWESKCALVVFCPSEESKSWTDKKIEDVKRIAQEFITAPTNRVQVLSADDHR